MDTKQAREKVSEYLTKCSDASSNSREKCEAIQNICGMLLGTHTELLPDFVDDILKFAHDGSVDVRQCVVGFVKQLSDNHTQFFPNVVSILSSLLLDTTSQILVEDKLPVRATTVFPPIEAYIPPRVVRPKNKKDATTVGENSSNVL